MDASVRPRGPLRPLPPSPRLSRGQQLQVAERAYLEQAVASWEAALGADPHVDPVPQAPRRRPSYLISGQTVSAPRARSVEVRPSDVRVRAGERPASENEMRKRLAAETVRVVQAAVNVVLHDHPADATPAVRSYTFDEAVDEADGVAGRLYTVSTDGRTLSEFRPGVPTLHLVEILEDGTPGHNTPKKRTLHCTVTGGEAHWTYADARTSR